MTRDGALGAAGLALAAAYYAMAAAISATRLADSVGPAGLPKAYAVVLGALSLILIARSLRRPREDAEPAAGSLALRRVAGLLAIGVLYILVVSRLGYVLSLGALLAATIYYQGGALNRRTALVAVGGALFFWLLFVRLLGISQPSGLW